MKNQNKNQINSLHLQIAHLQQEMQKILVSSTEKIEKQQLTNKKQLKEQQEKFKADKKIMQQNKQTQFKNLKLDLQSKNNRSVQNQMQIQSLRGNLLQQQQNNAKLTAKLNENISDIKVNDSLRIQVDDLTHKMILKDQQIKKAFNNIQNMKNTISELEQGIQTCQSYAESKGIQIDELQGKCKILIQKYDKIVDEHNRMLKNIQQRTKMNEEIFENQERKINEVPMNSIEQNRDHILPIKRLFMKYFEAGSSYNSKIQTLNTLCQVFKLNEKEQMTLQNYKKHKLILEIPHVEKKQEQTLQNKFFTFLTAE